MLHATGPTAVADGAPRSGELADAAAGLVPYKTSLLFVPFTGSARVEEFTWSSAKRC
jgi:hypothetical protein